MKVMCDVYTTLRSLPYFVDNEHLRAYCRLIECNTRTKRVPQVTHAHHIIPVSWYKLTHNRVENSPTNMCNLPIRVHLLAHYYLCLCAEDPFKFANQLALMCLQSQVKNPVDLELFRRLPMYNIIYEDFVYKKKTRYMLYSHIVEEVDA